MDNRTLFDLEQEFVHAVMLNGLAPLAGERTLQALYYILRGRKANQTLQDVYLYSLHPYYRMFPRLTKESWEENVQLFLSKGFVQMKMVAGGSPKPTFELTELGKAEQHKRRLQFNLDRWFSAFDSSAQAEQLSMFWQRLHLLVQTVSQLLADDVVFQPVVQNRQVQTWVKRILASPELRLKWQAGLFDELYALLSALPQEVQELIVRQFSGVSQTGQTISQLAMESGQAPSYLLLQVRYGLAVMVKRLKTERTEYPLLATLIQLSAGKDVRLSESAAKTYMLVLKNASVEEIARKRNIKPSTVEDHLVEIALHCPEWNCSDYLSAEERADIIGVSERLGTSRLRLLKDELGPGYSYLKIRLALALGKGGKQDGASLD